jgi:uncharacterized protein (TIGR02284 family)
MMHNGTNTININPKIKIKIMNIEKSIEVFNKLIIVNNERIEGYKTAAKVTKEVDLRVLFYEFMRTSIFCKQELVAEVRRLGGKPENNTRIAGKFFRFWIKFKLALTRDDRAAILESCEFGEDIALATYKNILIQNHADTNVFEQNMLNKHYALLKSDYGKICNLQVDLCTKLALKNA